MAKIPVFQVHSFPRSGDTLLLRALSAHPHVQVVHQLRAKDDERDVQLARAVNRAGDAGLDSADPALSHRRVTPGTALVFKAGLRRPTSSRGLVYVRNPLDVMAAAGVARAQSVDAYVRDKEKCSRWSRAIDAAMAPFVLNTDNLTAFCVLYQRRMLQLWETGLPVVHHEQLVARPEPVLRRVLGAMGLDWDARVLSAHEQFRRSERGREQIRLWEPIAKAFIDEKLDLDQAARDKIYSLTALALNAYGYELRGKEILVDAERPERVSRSRLAAVAP